MITFFTTLKDMGTPQRNAIDSWRAAVARSEVIIMGSAADRIRLAKTDPDAARTMQVVPAIHNRPRVDAMFARVNGMAIYPIKCYVNADVILTDDLLPSVKLVADQFKEFMITGQRLDTNAIKTTIDFTAGYRGPLGPGEWRALRGLVVEHESTVLHITAGMDYFCYRGDVFGEIPPYAIAAYAWDTDLMCLALENIDAVVDGTKMITAIHQNHKIGTRRNSMEAKYNLELLGRDGDWRQRLRGTQHARYFLDAGEVRRRQ